MKHIATTLAALLLPALLIGCSGGEATVPPKKGPEAKAVEPKTTPPAAKVEMSVVKFEHLLTKAIPEYKGKIVVLDIWGTWCAPCKKEFPGLIRMHEKYGDKGVQCMSLCMPAEDGDVKNKPPALAFLEANKANFPNYWLEDGWAPIQKKLKFGGLPVVVVFGKDGQIAKTFTNDDAGFTYTDVEAFVKELLKPA